MRRTYRFAAPLLAAFFFTPVAAAQASVLIAIDTVKQRMTVSVDGAPRWNWPVSTGRRGYATPAGEFRAFRMVREHYSREWDFAPMPYSIFFTDEGHAIHGSYETWKLGRRASHGCVRLAPKNAAKLFALVREHGLATATVVVGDGRAPLVAKRREPQKTPQQTEAKAVPGTAPQSLPAPAPAAMQAPAPSVVLPEVAAFPPPPAPGDETLGFAPVPPLPPALELQPQPQVQAPLAFDAATN